MPAWELPGLSLFTFDLTWEVRSPVVLTAESPLVLIPIFPALAFRGQARGAVPPPCGPC